MVLRLSVIVQVLVVQFGLRLASSGRVMRLLGLPVEATQRRAEVVKHDGKVAIQRRTTAD
jgi:hypothetical protein